MCNTDSKIFVDGFEHSTIKANEALKLTLDEGEHIIQAKNEKETLSKTISCTDSKQKVLTFEFGQIEPAPTVSNTELITVTKSEIQLPGSLTTKTPYTNKFYAFEKGDEISFDIKVLNKKGTLNIYFYSYPDNSLVFSKQSEQEVTNEKIIIPKRGVYRFAFATNHVFDRSAYFAVYRKPASDDAISFKTSVKIQYDTSYQEVLNSQVRVYSRRNMYNSNTTIVKVPLPENTTYWVYWIGVGQESMDKMKEFSAKLSKGAAGLAANPIYALGLGLISALPMFNSTATINYRFMDNINANNFNTNIPYSCYTFKEGNNITTDYTVTQLAPKEVNLCLWNTNAYLGHDVKIQVGAFTVRQKYVPEE
jgi:hypothetical protein